MDVPKGMKAGQTFVLDLEKKPAGARQQTLAQKLPTAAARKPLAFCCVVVAASVLLHFGRRGSSGRQAARWSGRRGDAARGRLVLCRPCSSRSGATSPRSRGC